ncbi:hypothetical protein ACFE04_011087 [Oxalis oulophora]
MASITMTTSSFLGTTVANGSFSPAPLLAHGRLVVSASSTKTEVAKMSTETNNVNGRRDLVFAAAAAAFASVAAAAMADEPKRGSPEAKKAYASLENPIQLAKVTDTIP